MAVISPRRLVAFVSIALALAVMASVYSMIAFFANSLQYLYQDDGDDGRNNNVTQQDGTSPSTNRSLVIVMGELRGGEKAWRTLYRRVLDPNMADLAVMTPHDATNLGRYPNNTLTQRARYVWSYPNEYDDWSDAIDLINGTSWRTTHLPLFKDWDPTGRPGQNRTILFGGIKGHDGSGIIVMMLRYFLTQHVQSSGVLDRYDTFVVTRVDHYYGCPYLFAPHHGCGSCCDLSNGTVDIYIPGGQEYGGYTDRHMVVSKHGLLDALDIIPALILRPYHFYYNQHHNTERFFKSVWEWDKNLTVRKFPRTMFAVATDDDPTRWVKAEEELEEEPGLFVKYKTEYWQSLSGCAAYWRDRQPIIVRGPRNAEFMKEAGPAVVENANEVR